MPSIGVSGPAWQGSRQHRPLRQHAGAPHQRDGQLAGGRRALVEVDQLVLQQALVGDGEPAGRHEPAGRVRGQAHLGGPALGHQPPLHGGEGALGHRRGGPRWAAAGGPGAGWLCSPVVVESDVHVHEVVAGVELQRVVRTSVRCDPTRTSPSAWVGSS